MDDKQIIKALKPFADMADALDEKGPPWICGEGVVGGCGKKNTGAYCDCSHAVQKRDSLDAEETRWD